MEFKIKDPVSAITHFIAMILALVAATPLLIKASSDGRLHLAALTVFCISMVFLYAASTIYHTLDISPKINRLLKKIDHMMIFILIAGTYTPVCLIVLGDETGWGLLALVWGIAVTGILIKACFIMCPKWFSSSLYIAMGWVCVLAFTKIIEASCFQRQTQKLRLPRDFSPLCHGRKPVPLYPDVPFCCLERVKPSVPCFCGPDGFSHPISPMSFSLSLLESFFIAASRRIASSFVENSSQ